MKKRSCCNNSCSLFYYEDKAKFKKSRQKHIRYNFEFFFLIFLNDPKRLTTLTKSDHLGKDGNVRIVPFRS